MRQVQRTRSASKQIERIEEERPERDERADEVSEQAECCLADIDALIDEACCLIAEAEAEQAPTQDEFDKEHERLYDIWLNAPVRSQQERDAERAMDAYREKWAQLYAASRSNSCVC